MTKESMAVLPALMHANDPKPAKKPQLSPIPAQPPAVPPPPAGAPGFIPPKPASAPIQGMQAPPPNPAMAPPIPGNPDPGKGAFPIKLIASIQLIYVQEQQKQDRLSGNMAQGMGLKPGWGGG